MQRNRTHKEPRPLAHKKEQGIEKPKRIVRSIKTDRIEIRITPEIKRIIAKAAAMRGISISSYIVDNSLTSAQKDIKAMSTIILDDEERDAFLELLNNPPAPNKALIKLLSEDPL